MTDEEYKNVRESFELAMKVENIANSVIQTILTTVDDAVDNNMDDDK
jgi:hypothetical protein